MYLFAGFTCGLHLELALADLSSKASINDNEIHVINMKYVPSDIHVVDSIGNPDGRSILDSICGWATAFGLLGIIYGSQWFIGPILTGLTGLAAGGLFGYFMDKARHAKKRHTADDLDIVLLIGCQSLEQIEQAERICCGYHVAYIGHHLHAKGSESV